MLEAIVLAGAAVYFIALFAVLIKQGRHKCRNCHYHDDRYKSVLDREDRTWCYRYGLSKAKEGSCDEWED